MLLNLIKFVEGSILRKFLKVLLVQNSWQSTEQLVIKCRCGPLSDLLALYNDRILQFLNGKLHGLVSNFFDGLIGRLGSIVLFTSLFALVISGLFLKRLLNFGRLHRPSRCKDHRVHPGEVWLELLILLAFFECCQDSIQGQIFQHGMGLVGELIRCWWEADILVSKHSRHDAISVINVD